MTGSNRLDCTANMDGLHRIRNSSAPAGPPMSESPAQEARRLSELLRHDPEAPGFPVLSDAELIDEVRWFLLELAQQLEQAERENRNLKADLDRMRKELLRVDENARQAERRHLRKRGRLMIRRFESWFGGVLQDFGYWLYLRSWR
jgi:hypothetical protein